MRLTVDTIAETLLTYSWVLLIFGLFITLLGAFGYFDTIGRLPDACETAGPFACLSVEATNSSELTIVLRSGLNSSLQVVDAQVLRLRPPCEGIADLTANREPLPMVIGPLDIVRVEMRCTGRWDARVLDGDVVVSFINETGDGVNASLFVRSGISR